MRIINKLRNVVSHIPKKAAIASGILALVMVPAALMAYGPERDTYTIKNPADHVTFNSITDNPNIGDERNFVGARDATTENIGWYADSINVEDGKEYYVRMYVHNNAGANLNLVAEDVTAKFNVPTTTGNSVTVSGILSSSNATPTEYWDSVKFVSDAPFNLAYVAGSAKYENNAIGANGGVKLADSIVTNSGVKLGYDKLDGKIPGCFQYAGYVTFKVKPQVQHVAAIGLTKSVAPHNNIADPTDKLEQTNWQQSITTKPGDVVDYVIDYRNAGTGNQLGVVIRDMLPSNMTYVPGSTKYIIYQSDGKMYREGDWGGDDTITTNGINASEANSGFAPTKYPHSYVAMFSAKVNEDVVSDVPCGTSKTLKNVARVSATVDGKRFYNEDDADVIVKEDCEPAEFTCDRLNVNKVDRTKFEFTTDYTVKNTKYNSISYAVSGDGVYDKHTSTAIDGKLNYNQTKAGDYDVIATLNTADGSKTSTKCQGEITVEPEPVESEAICKVLNAKPLAIKPGETVGFEVVPEYVGDVKVVGSYIDYGDGTKTTVANTYRYSHIYNKEGKYKAKAYINFIVDGKAKNDVTSVECEESVEVTKTPPTEHCDVPGKEHLPKDDPNCISDVVTPKGPTSLPKAGIEAIGGIIGLGSMTTAGAYYISSRRKL